MTVTGRQEDRKTGTDVSLARTPESELEPITSSSPSHTSSPPALSLGEKVRAALPLIWRDFRAAFSDLAVLKWSVWWALAMCGNFQVFDYTP